MRPNIHPAYREVLFHDTNADAYFTLDISSASHAFYTGEQRQTNHEGRVASFNKLFSRFKRSH